MIYSIFGKKFRAKLKEAFACRNNSLNNIHTNQQNPNNLTHLNNTTNYSNISNGNSNQLSLFTTPIDFTNSTDETNHQILSGSVKKPTKIDLRHNETFV